MACHAAGQTIDTVFIGGGTPSLLPAGQLGELLTGLRSMYPIGNHAEITSEANPGTLTAEWLDTAVRCGVNRLSLGMQALQPELLRTLGRIHDFQQVQSSVEMARQAGVRSLSLDLMFGLPGQTPEMWRETLDAALSLEPEHLSCYGLIPEEGTPLNSDLESGHLTLPDEDDERRMYDDTLTILAQHGYLQYEISNFARPGHECRHNIGYWRQIPYVGLGAAAASMLKTQDACLRTTNPPGLSDYMAMVAAGQWERREQTIVSAEDARFETLMLGLRMNEGVSEEAFAAMHGVTLDSQCGAALRSLEKRSLLVYENGSWRLTRRGMDVQNAILVELMEAMERGCPE